MKQKKQKMILLLCLLSQLVWSDTTAKTQPAPELSVPRFDFDEKTTDSKRQPANQDDAQDLLSELESLLENPAQRDAKTQLGIPSDVIDPIPQMKADIPIENPKKAEVVKPLAPRVSTDSKSKRTIKSPIVKKTIYKTNELVAVEFLVEGKTQKIVLESRDPLKFKLVPKKKNSQLVYVFEKTGAPKKLRRSYDTREFKSPISLYQITQTIKKKVPATALSIRMRDFSIPKAIQIDNKLVLEFQDKSKSERLLASELPSSSFSEDAFRSGQGYQGEPIEKLELKNTDVSEAIKLVLRSSGYNVVLGDDVKGNIGALSLQNIPWDQALHIILQMKKLGFVRKGNLIRVATLDSLKIEQEELQRQENLEPLQTVLLPISYAKATTLAPRATPFLSPRGKVDVDDRTNTLIIRDGESVINRLKKLFSALDTQPPMISISAKFLEVKKNFTRSLGLGTLNLSGQTSGINFGAPQEASTSAGFSAGSASGTINLSAPKFAALNAQLAVAESQNKAKTLSNPTIVVQQGQSGNITQGKTINIPQSVGLGSSVNTSLSVTANLNLTVTPVVANDGSISLDTNITDSSADTAGTIVTTSNRALTTQIILQNGDTAVLGGITAGKETSQSGGVPFLKDLPLLGYLFGQRIESTDQTEVLIFITARILNPEATFKQTI